MHSRRPGVMFLATGFYVGRMPFAPGTVGTLIGLPVAYVIGWLSLPLAMAAAVALILGAVWIAQEAEQQLGQKDPGCIVIDEIAGMCVTLLGIPLTFGTGLAGFILFRLFDIAKPPPIRYLERRLPGGWGVVMDDVAAGLIAQIVLRVGLALVG